MRQRNYIRLEFATEFNIREGDSQNRVARIPYLEHERVLVLTWRVVQLYVNIFWKPAPKVLETFARQSQCLREGLLRG